MTQTKVALVTGGGNGIGAAVARKLGADGFSVGVLSPSENAEKVAKEIGGFAVRGSVTEGDDVASLIRTAIERHGRIDALFNGTGHPPKGGLLELSDDDWRKGFEMVFVSIVRTTRLVTPIMQKNGGGAIVNLSSYAALEPEADFPLTTVRAGVNAWTKLYASIYGKDNIRMNALLPGFADSLPEKDTRRQRIPLGRYARVDEMASVAAFLLSDASSYITGQNIRVDGGLTRFAG
jgi:NAD(P)-dependent dehydrogenase (short-subunit alcohol dehydrogenase family)